MSKKSRPILYSKLLFAMGLGHTATFSYLQISGSQARASIDSPWALHLQNRIWDHLEMFDKHLSIQPRAFIKAGEQSKHYFCHKHFIALHSTSSRVSTFYFNDSRVSISGVIFLYEHICPSVTQSYMYFFFLVYNFLGSFKTS